MEESHEGSEKAQDIVTAIAVATVKIIYTAKDSMGNIGEVEVRYNCLTGFYSMNVSNDVQGGGVCFDNCSMKVAHLRLVAVDMALSDIADRRSQIVTAAEADLMARVGLPARSVHEATGTMGAFTPQFAVFGSNSESRNPKVCI